MRTVGTVVRGIRCPIFRQGDDLAAQVVSALKESWENEGYSMQDHDVVAITESVVARTQGNYVTVDQIAADVRSKFPGGEVGVAFPILSRNRFSVLLRGIARGVKKMHLLLSYPSDEVSTSSVLISLYLLMRLSASASAVSIAVRQGIPSMTARRRSLTESRAGRRPFADVEMM